MVKKQLSNGQVAAGVEVKIGEPVITRFGCVCSLPAQHLSRQLRQDIARVLSYKTLRLIHPFTRTLANVASLEFDLNGTLNLEAMTLRPIPRQHPERALSQGRNLIAECQHGKQIFSHMQSNLWRLGDAWLYSQTALNLCFQKFG